MTWLGATGGNLGHYGANTLQHKAVNLDDLFHVKQEVGFSLGR